MTEGQDLGVSDAIGKVMSTLSIKGDHYKEQPLEYMRVDDLLPIIRLKVERAIQVKSLDKKIDDVLDMTCYSLKILQRLLDEKANRPEVTKGDTQ